MINSKIIEARERKMMIAQARAHGAVRRICEMPKRCAYPCGAPVNAAGNKKTPEPWRLQGAAATTAIPPEQPLLREFTSSDGKQW